jgi:DNA-binding transcriptional LysR family regulator
MTRIRAVGRHGSGGWGAVAVLAGAPVFEDFNLLRAAALAGQGVALCPWR